MAPESNPIVICGMAVRLPGDIKNTQDFWELMMQKKSGLIPIPQSRWNLEGFYSPVQRWGTIRNKECYMLSDRDLAHFDASYFTCGEKEIEKMDPMQRQLLEIARECLDNAGEAETRNKKVGCYVGNFSSDWQDDLSMDPHASGLYRGSGYLDFLQPNRVSYDRSREAVNAVYVKRMSDALRDGNPIRAVLRASATNNDGRSNGIMNPNTYQQEALIRQTYEEAGITDLSKTAFFECHGTGTPTGDPLEVAAVARVWKDHGGILIGAVKPNVGHSEGAAGLTSVIKAVLALEHRTIPPNIFLENPNPKRQGVHWAGMGKTLLKTNKVFGDTIRKLDRWLRTLPDAHRPEWTVRAELLKEGEASRVGARGFSHPCATAVQIALVDVLRSLGVVPQAVVAHSGGESAAAYAAGIISAEAAMVVAYYRGWLLQNDKAYAVPKGTMAYIGLGAKELTKFLIPGVVIGCENSPLSSTLSGDPVCIQHCIDQIHRRHPEVSTSLLKVETSFHSPWIEPLGEPYEKLLQPYLTDVKAPSVPYFSSVTGEEMTGNDFGATYFRKNFVQPVLFNSAVGNLLQSNEDNLFIEIGSHPALQAPIGEIMKSRSDTEYGYIATLKRGDDQSVFLLRLAGELFMHGISADLNTIIAKGRVLTDVPTYPWLHVKRYMDEPRNPARYKAREYTRHDLLGARIVEGNDIEPAWRNMLDVKEASWLLDHIVNDQVVFPGAGYIGIAGEAIRQISGGRGAYTIRDMVITTPLTLPKDRKMEIYTRLIPEDTTDGIGHQWYHFKVMTCDGQHWLSHCTGWIRTGADTLPVVGSKVPSKDKAEHEFPRQVPSNEWYSSVKKLGIEWRNAFQGLEDITASTVTQEASATVYDFDDATHYEAHPTLLDQMLQTNLIAMTHGLKRRLTDVVLPTKIGHIAVLGAQELRMRVYGAIKEDLKKEKLMAQSTIYTEDGRLSVYMDNLEFGILPKGKQEDPLLGSYFKWDTDISLLDSLEKDNASQVLEGHSLDSKSQGDLNKHQQEFHEVVRLLGFKTPDARVVEIGSGSTQVAQVALDALHPSPNDRFYQKYTYASVNDESIETVSKALCDEAEGGVGKPDVTVGGIEQVSLSDGADIVIVPADTLSADDDLVLDELESLKTVVSSNGRLVIHNLGPAGLGEATDQQLKQLGFRVSSRSKTGVITAELKSAAPGRTQTVTVLKGESAGSRALAQNIKAVFESKGSTVKFSHARAVPSDADLVISLLDLDESIKTSAVHSLDASTFRPFVDSLCTLSVPLIWLLPMAHTACNKPHAAMIQGLARTVRIEHKADITLVEVDKQTTARGDFANPVWKIAQSLAGRRTGGHLDADYDYAIRDGVVKIPRMKWFSFKDTAVVGEGTIPSSPSTSMFKGDASYLLVGGFGGLGRSIATWMVEHGARNLIILARSATHADNENIIKELEGYPGCTVTAVSGDVGKYEDVVRAIKSAPAPIAGVMQLSLVLKDNSTKDMSFDEWMTVVQPRVTGTWNVHEALIAARATLDFFMIFGSGGGHTGYYGQANYSASNTFLDAFVQYRHQLGLPASVVDLGVVGDIGYLLEQDHLYEAFKNGGFFFLTEQQVLDAAAISLANNSPQAGTAGPLSSFCLGGLSVRPMTDPANRVNWKRDVRFALSHYFHKSSPQGSAGGTGSDGEHDDEAARLIALATSDPDQLRDAVTIAALAKLLARSLSELMLRPAEDFPTNAALASIGLDSIVSIELVDWIQQQFHIGLSSIEITSSKSLTHLAEKIVGELTA
ncbi:Type I Iterative PKS [Gnomoniopsis sp. IMI 355080]|nr:Type I Iterative PKS [Gnomoniopsis sp. IMI 355080]